MLLWFVALGVGAQRLWHARTAFADRADEVMERQRPDSNSGHAQIDFGGQWVMGRMLVLGHARELYNRNRQWEVVRAAYPVEHEQLIVRTDLFSAGHARVFPGRKGDDLKHDADWMMVWFMGEIGRAHV